MTDYLTPGNAVLALVCIFFATLMAVAWKTTRGINHSCTCDPTTDIWDD